jgi:fucose 4-O-acetylase-like acetyltransferase
MIGNDTASHSRKKLSVRSFGLIEVFRIVAACGVVWFHLEGAPGRRVGFAGLVFFLTVTVLFQARSHEQQKVNDYLQRRSLRLLVPWGAWFLIYLLVGVAKGKAPVPTEVSIEWVLSGPWIGLWFLPFAFLSGLLVHAAVAGLSGLAEIRRGALCEIVAVLSFVAACLIRENYYADAPWAQWIQAFPSIPIGIAISCNLGRPSRILIFQTVILSLCIAFYSTDRGMSISYGIGILFVSAGVCIKYDAPSLVFTLSALCLGVYLLHGIVMSALGLIDSVREKYALHFFATAIISFILVAIGRRFKPFRFIT